MMPLDELLEHCAAREAVMLKDGLHNGERLEAVLNEYDHDEVWALGEAMATCFINMMTIDREGPIQTALVAWLMGMEMGREIERRMP